MTDGTDDTDARVARFLVEAQATTGLTDWGPGICREVLARLTDDVIRSRPHARGWKAFEDRVDRILRNRLRLIEDRRTDPAIARQRVEAPLFVMGLPRTGTTFLHSLLAQDPRSRSPAEWEAMRPSPPPRRETYCADPRIAASEAEARVDAEALKRHIQGERLPIECGPAALTYEFLTSGFDIRWRTPWLRERMKGPVPSAYVWHRRLLEHLQAHTDQSHWVLKSPEHIGHLPELLAEYPDARIVFTHRTPVEVFPSLASLTVFMQEENLGPVPRHEIGPEVLAMWRHLLDAALAYRRSIASSAVILDVLQTEILADPLAVVERIYEHFGMPFALAARSSMERWLAVYGKDRYQESHGRHLYTAAEYGLDAGELQRSFADYIGEFRLA